MRFPDKDKLRRAKIIAKERGIDWETPKGLLELAEIYEKEIGGKVRGKEFYEKELLKEEKARKKQARKKAKKKTAKKTVKKKK